MTKHYTYPMVREHLFFKVVFGKKISSKAFWKSKCSLAPAYSHLIYPSQRTVTWLRSNYITKKHVLSSCGLYVQECHPLAIYYKAGCLAKIIVVLLCGPWAFSWYHVPSTLLESPNQLTPFNCTLPHTHTQKCTGTQTELHFKLTTAF